MFEGFSLNTKYSERLNSGSGYFSFRYIELGSGLKTALRVSLVTKGNSQRRMNDQEAPINRCN